MSHTLHYARGTPKWSAVNHKQPNPLNNKLDLSMAQIGDMKSRTSGSTDVPHGIWCNDKIVVFATCSQSAN